MNHRPRRRRLKGYGGCCNGGEQVGDEARRQDQRQPAKPRMRERGLNNCGERQPRRQQRQ